MSSIKEELMLKAQRDLTKLVQVQRMVSRSGKTFTQNFWIKPADVKTTDKVIGNQQVLTSFLNPKQVPAPPAGVLDKVYLDSLKTDKPKALDYLKSCGVKWQEHTHSGINWMRAMQAFTDALSAQSGQTVSSQGKPQPQPVSQTSAQNSQSKAPSTELFNKLSSAQQEVNACKNGKEKVVVLRKKLGVDLCVELADSLGVTWEKNPHPAINWMRLATALQKHFDAVDGTVSPTNQKKSDKVGAPKNNKNAKKDSVKLDDDKLEIPASAVERDKNIINLINNISDTNTLELISKSGFVPEDDGAKEFIENSLYKEYEGTLAKAVSTTASVNRGYYSSSDSIAKEVSGKSSKMFKGLSKKCLYRSLSYNGILEQESIFQMIHPRHSLKIHDASTPPGSTNVSNLKTILLLNSREFNTYSKDDTGLLDSVGNHIACSAIGYTGFNNEVYESQYSLEDEGFVHILRHIASSNPELKDTVDSMVSDYDDLMKSAHYNPRLIYQVLNLDYESYANEQKETEKQKEAYKIIEKAMKDQGFTDSEIKFTLENKRVYISSGEFPVLTGSMYPRDIKVDSNGDKVMFDIGSLTFPDGSPIYRNIPSAIKYLKSAAEDSTPYSTKLTEDEYDNITSLVYKLGRIKLVDKTTMLEPTRKFHEMDRWDYREFSSCPLDDDEKFDAVLSNVFSIMKQHAFKKNIRENITALPSSSANSNGYYNGNFEYYVPSDDNEYGWGDGYTDPRNHQSRFLNSFKNADEEKALIKKQLSQNSTYSVDYFKKLKDYVTNEGNPNYTGDRWGRTYASTEHSKAYSVDLFAREFDLNVSSPANDILMDILADAAQYCPQNYNTRVQTPEKLKSISSSKVGYTPYVHKSYINQGSSASSPALKVLRQKAFEKAHCSLSKVPDAVRQDVEHTVKINFDRVDPVTGKRVPKPERIYDDRTLVFHSGVYEIKNSTMREEFDKESKRMKETPTLTFHGTSYSGACGINGVDGKFRFRSSDKLPGQKNSGTMLGEGIYAAKLVGKCCPYIGTNPYSYTSYTASDLKTPDNKADGVIMVCETIFGKHGEFMDSYEAKRHNKNNGGTYDSVAVGAGALMPGGGTLKEYECIVTRQNMMAPKYLIDVGARRR